MKFLKHKCNLYFFNLREQKLHILHNFENKIETKEGLKVLQNALHVSAKSAENSASAHEKPALAIIVVQFVSINLRFNFVYFSTSAFNTLHINTKKVHCF
jgi:hypothetical protein